ncbi:MAG: HDOD domain-containing protein [Candidatus Aureabacteria bacterium]|nr:HDOD domain-containing protein [Candidatus Auribacterota bacterium]
MNSPPPPSHLILNKEAFRKKVERLHNLPTLPQLMKKFTKMAEDTSTSIASFGEEICKDQVLTSKLLRLVNSAFYGFPGRISTVTHALILLGIDAIKGLIVTTSVFDNLTPEAYPLWRHSILVSLACRKICEMLSIADIEEITVAGLLHDIGKVVIILEAPDEYHQVLKHASQTKTPLWKTEHELLGFDHAALGKWLCQQWKLPDKLSLPIGYHHEPEKAVSYPLRSSIITISNLIVNGMGESLVKGIPLENIPECVAGQLSLQEHHLEKLVERIEPEMEALKDMGPLDLK